MNGVAACFSLKMSDNSNYRIFPNRLCRGSAVLSGSIEPLPLEPLPLEPLPLEPLLGLLGLCAEKVIDPFLQM